MSFADLGLSDELLRAVGDTGYTEPTPIQASAIPSVLMMRDMIGIAQTGTGKTASFEQAEEVCAHIRKTVAAEFGQEAADGIRIQYGGSVKPATIKDLMKQPNVDGALVGGASLKAKDFSEIVNY